MLRPLLFLLAGLTAAQVAGWYGFPRLLYKTQAQPFEYRHKTHADKSGASDCDGCHTLRPDGVFAGLPNTESCAGCGACMTACAAENNVAPGNSRATARTGLTPMLVHRVTRDGRTAFLPVTCMHCENETPCVTVCPQQAVELDKATGIVTQMPQRCLGCRYCMTACAYHARYFNWWDPEWSPGMERTLNPGVAVRMRGVVEKCNFCHGRLHESEDKAAAEGRDSINPADYRPACVEACATHAITFGDLNDPDSEVSIAAKSPEAFRLLARLGTEPKIYYTSKREWVRDLAERGPKS